MESLIPYIHQLTEVYGLHYTLEFLYLHSLLPSFFKGRGREKIFEAIKMSYVIPSLGQSSS